MYPAARLDSSELADTLTRAMLYAAIVAAEVALDLECAPFIVTDDPAPFAADTWIDPCGGTYYRPDDVVQSEDAYLARLEADHVATDGPIGLYSHPSA